MTEKDSIEQAEAILLEARQQVAAETTKVHAEMILLSCVLEKPVLMAQLLHKASENGIDYMTGILVAVGLSARNWGRVMADAPLADFTRYLDPDAEDACDGGFAHYLCKEILVITTTDQAERLREEMKNFAATNEPLVWGRVVVHTVGLYRELVDAVAGARNGDPLEE